jgi:hypothetical protein
LQRFKAGASVLAMIMSEDADNYEIRKFAPPPANKKQRAEFVKNTVYFGISGNHVVLTQKPGFDASHLQSHLQWLLDRCIPEFTGKVLFLKDSIPADYRKRKLSGVKLISMATNPQLRAEEVATPSSGPMNQSWIIDDDPLVAAVLGMLKSHSPSESHGSERRDVLTLSDAYAKGTLRARILLEYVGGLGETSPLDNVAEDLLATEGLNWEMELPHHEPFRSEDAKIKRKYPVTCNDDVIEPKSAFEKMALIISELVKDAKIIPDP